MLVGDYCPRALDPIVEMRHAVQKQVEIEETLHYSAPVVSHEEYHEEVHEEVPAVVEHPAEPASLPCNVFGTVDRCDGMGCEHDGNCFSGCCSLFVSGDQKRCMPLVGDGLCPIAIDVVDHEGAVAIDEPTVVFDEVDTAEDDDSPLHYIDHKELSPTDEEQMIHEDTEWTDLLYEDDDLPMIEKTEHHQEYEEEDHFIPEKVEHAYMEEDSYIEHDHVIPDKSEHFEPDVHELPRERWLPDYHGHSRTV